VKLYTGEISHSNLYEESRYMEDVLTGAGVQTIYVCCAFGVDVDHPLFAKDVEVEVSKLSDYLRHHEATGAFRLGHTNISLTYDFDQFGLKFSFGNDNDIFCEGNESSALRDVLKRWKLRYPSSGCVS
jgi:hypothetical protein